MMTIVATAQLQGLDHAPAPRVRPLPQTARPRRGLFSRLIHTFRAWSDRLHDRAVLLRLDDRLLADIGFTRYEMEVLLSRPRSINDA